MISSVPVYAGVLGVFSHTRVGANAAHGLLRGMAVGAFSVVSFFVVVGLLLERLGIPATYVLAACAAMATAFVCRPIALRVREPVAAPGE
jgi:type III secretory pathway component EscR